MDNAQPLSPSSKQKAAQTAVSLTLALQQQSLTKTNRKAFIYCRIDTSALIDFPVHTQFNFQLIFFLGVCVCVLLCVFSSAEPVPCCCSVSQKVSLHLQGLRSVSDGSGRQSDGQRPQGRRHARDTLHLQVSV